jgi:hypothetical protein
MCCVISASTYAITSGAVLRDICLNLRYQKITNDFVWTAPTSVCLSIRIPTFLFTQPLPFPSPLRLLSYYSSSSSSHFHHLLPAVLVCYCSSVPAWHRVSASLTQQRVSGGLASAPYMLGYPYGSSISLST